jgi:hypothetical protein
MTRLEFNNEVVAILAKDLYDYVYGERLETGDNQHIVCPCGVKKDCRITGYIDVVRKDAGNGYAVITVHRDPLFRSPNVCECPISSDATAKMNEELAKLCA